MLTVGLPPLDGVTCTYLLELAVLLMMNPMDLANHLESLGALANPPSVGRVAGTINAARLPARSALSTLAVAPNAEQGAAQ